MAFDLDDEELKATRKLNGIDKNVGSIEEDIKILEEMLKTRKEQKEIIECAGGYCGNCNPDIKALENAIQTIRAYKKLEEELKEEKELNKIIKNTKLDELFTTPRRNGKTIELAIQLREEILKLPECKLYGIKNCKNKVVLLTKEECIPVSLVEEKIEKYKNKIDKLYNQKVWNEPMDTIYKNRYVNYINILQELLEKR